MAFRTKGGLQMKKAELINELLDSFDPRPLSNTEKIDEFYVDTTDARGEDASGKMRYILEHTSREDLKFLFMGHNGCGKSTELFKVAKALQNEYVVVHYSIREYTDILGVSFIDIIFSVLRNISKKAIDLNIAIEPDIASSIYHYWKDEQVVTITKEEAEKVEADAVAGLSILQFLSTKIKIFLQSSSVIKREVKDRIEPSIPELINRVNNFIKDFQRKLPLSTSDNGRMGRKKLLVMIDDLDKLELAEAENIFINHCRPITSLCTNIVYTFPIYLYYSPKFTSIASEFDEPLILSMIKVKAKNGSNFPLGIKTIKDIIFKRANESLFECGVVDFLIEKSGGSIRTVFTLIREAMLDAEIKYLRYNDSIPDQEKIISIDNAKYAYRKYKSSMEKVIRKDQLPLLKEVAGNKSPIIDKENVMVMDLLMSLVIIEYNGERWCDLNPAVRDYLEEQGEIAQ